MPQEVIDRVHALASRNKWNGPGLILGDQAGDPDPVNEDDEDDDNDEDEDPGNAAPETAADGSDDEANTSITGVDGNDAKHEDTNDIDEDSNESILSVHRAC